MPLLDGIALRAVGQAETLVRLGLRQRAAVAPLTGGSATIGIDPALEPASVALSMCIGGSILPRPTGSLPPRSPAMSLMQLENQKGSLRSMHNTMGKVTGIGAG